MHVDAFDFDQVIEQYHLAAGEFVRGNPEPYKKLFSQREDVTLGNPFMLSLMMVHTYLQQPWQD